MGPDDIIPFFIALYVLWSMIKGAFSARRGQPPTREQSQPEPSHFPWESEQQRGKHAPQRSASRRNAPRSRAPSRTPTGSEPWPYAETHAGEHASPPAGTSDPEATANLYAPPRKGSHVASARPARSRARKLLANRRDLVRGMVAHEILGPPVSERQGDSHRRP